MMGLQSSSKSPFDEALSKPLISRENNRTNQEYEDHTTSHDSSITNPSLKTIKSPLQATNTAKLPRLDQIPETSNKHRNKNDKSGTSSYQPPKNIPPTSHSIQKNHTYHNNNTNNDHPNTNNIHEHEHLLQFYPTQQSQSTTLFQSITPIENALLQERYTETKHIKSQMETIRDISLDLNTLVHQQQETIDDIEENIQDVEENVQQGYSLIQNTKMLMQKYYNSGNDFCNYFIGVLAGGGFFVAVVFWFLINP